MAMADAERFQPASLGEWHDWLAAHHDRGAGVWVVIWRASSGETPLTYEELIREALHPYPAHLVIATKAGLERSGPDQWRTDCRPDRLQAHCEVGRGWRGVGG